MSMYFLSPTGKYSSKLKVINPLLATLLTNTSSRNWVYKYKYTREVISLG